MNPGGAATESPKVALRLNHSFILNNAGCNCGHPVFITLTRQFTNLTLQSNISVLHCYAHVLKPSKIGIEKILLEVRNA